VKKLGDEVARELGRFGAAEGMTRIVEAWPDAVGPTIARNAWPARIARDGTLHVSTSSSSWAFELAQLERDVHRRLRAVAGTAAPKSLRFAVGRIPEPSYDEIERVDTTVEPSPEHLAEGASLSRVIDDEELRKMVAKAAALSLAKAASDRTF
jgi:hypothetical protein